MMILITVQGASDYSWPAKRNWEQSENNVQYIISVCPLGQHLTSESMLGAREVPHHSHKMDLRADRPEKLEQSHSS